MNYYKFFHFLFCLVVISLSLIFASCSKEDVDIDELYNKLLENQNDLVSKGLRGPIKNWRKVMYYPTDSLHIKKISDNELLEYDNDGYLTRHTKFINYGSLKSPEFFPRNVTENISRDSRKRITEKLLLSIQKLYNEFIIDTTWYSCTYNDEERTATVFTKRRNSRSNEIENKKRVVYELNKYGRIDENNMEEYAIITWWYSLKKEEAVTFQAHSDYDSWGNMILTYRFSPSSPSLPSPPFPKIYKYDYYFEVFYEYY